MSNLCFGGSFNPIHHGHLIVARAVAEARGYEGVVLIPSAQPPHKAGHGDLAPPPDRLAMCALAAAESTGFEVDGLELARKGPSYTIDTARELRRRGAPDVHWMIGADMLQILPKWHQAEALLAEVQLIIVARPGWSFAWDTLPPTYQSLRDHVVSAPLIDITATQLRRRAAAGLSLAWLTPPAVEDYIRQKRLYAPASPVVHEPPE